jgi:hypothetical protein
MGTLPTESDTPFAFTGAEHKEQEVVWEKLMASRTLAWMALSYVAALGLSVAMLASKRVEVGVAGVVLVLTTGPIAFLMAVRGVGSEVVGGGVGGHDGGEKVEEIARMLREINSRATLSDDAVRVLNRHNERDVLVKAIEEDISAGDWEPALILVRELADRCGYRVDAEEYRKRIERARSETLDREVHEALGEFERLLEERRWDLAMADAARIARLWPESPRAMGLRERVEHARATYRAELEREFLVAAKDGRAERALEVLKEFDFYLTPEEAAPYQELVRGLVTRARENLGAEFKLAVQDRNWKLASQVGERVIAEFPNTRMAAEIREVIDQIRERARG